MLFGKIIGALEILSNYTIGTTLFSFTVFRSLGRRAKLVDAHNIRVILHAIKIQYASGL